MPIKNNDLINIIFIDLQDNDNDELEIVKNIKNLYPSIKIILN